MHEKNFIVCGSARFPTCNNGSITMNEKKTDKLYFLKNVNSLLCKVPLKNKTHGSSGYYICK